MQRWQEQGGVLFYYACNFSLTPAEWQRAAPERRVSQNALNRSLSDELVSLVADKGERFTGQVEPLGQDLVAVVRETRVFTGNRILS